MGTIEKIVKKWYNFGEKGGFDIMYAATMVGSFIDSEPETKKFKSEIEDIREEKLSIFTIIKFKNIMKKLWKNTNLKSRIEKNKNILNGKAVIKGTRVTPEAVFDYFFQTTKEKNNEESFYKQIKADFPSLSNEDLLAALVYAIIKSNLFKKFRDEYSENITG